MSQPVIAFIGAGNMAGYIIKGLVQQGYPEDHIIATCRTLASLEAFKEYCGIRLTTDNKLAVKQADIVVMGVKPNVIQSVMESLVNTFKETQPLLVSIAVGIKLENLGLWGGKKLPIVRMMPNLPIAVERGVSSLYANSLVSHEQQKLITQLFSPLSLMCWVESEQLIDVGAALAGSGPAYFYRFIEALIDGAESLGLAKDVAKTMALHTGLGALELLHQTNDDAAIMRKRVTSPGGTTAAALEVFDKQGLQEITHDAMLAAVNRAADIAKGQ